MNIALMNESKLTPYIKTKLGAIAESMLNSNELQVGVMSGKASEALFFAYYSQYIDDDALMVRVVSILSSIFDEIQKGYKYPTYSGGLAGVGWAVEHLAQNGFINSDTNKTIASLDTYLYPYMLNYLEHGNYDYLHGGLGIGMYYLSRSNSNPATLNYLSQLVNVLEKHSVQTEDGIAWISVSNLEKKSVQVFNLGLSHGISSIIVFLSKLNRIGIQVEKTRELVEGAVNFLLSQKRDKNIFHYPPWIEAYRITQIMDYSGRLAWCYNDLGISLALWQVGMIFNKDYWKQEAIDTLLHTSNILDLHQAGVNDGGLCHGAAGIAHIYNRMYSYTSNEVFKKSAVYWFEQTLKLATFENGLAGFKAFSLPEYGGYKNSYGLLEGIAGIGLALISAVSDIEPRWDSALLMS